MTCRDRPIAVPGLVETTARMDQAKVKGVFDHFSDALSTDLIERGWLYNCTLLEEGRVERGLYQ